MLSILYWTSSGSYYDNEKKRVQVAREISTYSLRSYFVFPTKLSITMSEVTAITFDTVLILREVFAKRRLVKVV